MTTATAPMLHLSTPGVVLTRSTYEDEAPRGVAALASVLGVLQGLVEPLCLHVDLDHVDDLGLPQSTLDDPLRVLRAPIPLGVRLPDVGNASVHDVDVLDAEAFTAWLAAECVDPAVSWMHLRTAAARARVHGKAPETLRNLEGQPFPTVRHHDGDGDWVAGPVAGSSIDPPVVLDASHEGFRLELQLRVVWPLWSEPGSPDQQALSMRIEQLMGAGWSLEHASGVFASLG